MAAVLSKNIRKTMVDEIRRWQQEQVIQPDLAVKLLSMYPDTAGSAQVIGILMTVGAVLIGLGAILFIASNWSTLAAVAKIALIMGAVAASYVSGWYCKFEPGSRPKLGSALLMLGALLYGSGIWLISQIFNLDTNLANGLLLWFMGVFPMTLLTRSQGLGILTVVLAGSWALCENHIPGLAVNHDVLSMPQFVVSLIASLFTTYRLRSRWSLIFTIVMAASWVAFNSSPIGMLSLGVALLAGYMWHAQKQPYLSPVYLMTGMIGSLGMLTAMTFSTSVINPNPSHLGTGLCLWLMSWAVMFTVAFQKKAFAPEIAVLGIVLMSGLMTISASFGLVQALISNAVLLAILLGLMFVSAGRHNSPMILNTAVVYLVLDIICRYFDFFFKTIDRSLFFVAGGFVFLIVATLLEQNRRKLLQGFSK